MTKKSNQVLPGMVIRLPDDSKKNNCGWLVVEAHWGGGGTGHGPHDIYPDAWQVIVKKLNSKLLPTKSERLFHQKTNCYANTFPEVEVLGWWQATEAKIVKKRLQSYESENEKTSKTRYGGLLEDGNKTYPETHSAHKTKEGP